MKNKYTRHCLCGESFESERRHQNICPSCIEKLPRKIICKSCQDLGAEVYEYDRTEIAMFYDFGEGYDIEYECLECLTHAVDYERTNK